MSTFTLTSRWRAKWWKIPWLVLRGRPYRSEVTYYSCEVTRVDYHPDGSVSMDFVATDGARISVPRFDLPSSDPVR